jgi:hypothetical protein
VKRAAILRRLAWVSLVATIMVTVFVLPMFVDSRPCAMAINCEFEESPLTVARVAVVGIGLVITLTCALWSAVSKAIAEQRAEDLGLPPR